jgi:hypothetical protein
MSEWDGVEVPWPTEMQEAYVIWDPPHEPKLRSDVGEFWFKNPKSGRKTAILVSKQPGGGPQIARTNIWQFVDNGNGTCTIIPSIHYIGHFHTSNPVTFKLIERP